MIKFFKKKNDDGLADINPRGVKYSLDRPSGDDVVKIKNQLDSMKKPLVVKFDHTFIQEISDRLYGPDADEYIKELVKLNDLFRPRSGRSALDLYDPNIVESVLQRQKKINNEIK